MFDLYTLSISVAVLIEKQLNLKLSAYQTFLLSEIVYAAPELEWQNLKRSQLFELLRNTKLDLYEITKDDN